MTALVLPTVLGLPGRFSATARTRVALVFVTAMYVALRFGFGAGEYALAAALLIVLLEFIRTAAGTRSNVWIAVECIAAALQPAIVLGVCFLPAPFGFGSEVPDRIIMDSPVFLLLLCLIASNSDAARPALLVAAALTVLAAWFEVRQLILADPHTITVADLNMSSFKTPLAYLRAQNDPHYFNYTLWQGPLINCTVIAAALGLGLFRVRRLARENAEQESSRAALAAFFSPQITDVILRARGTALAPQEKLVAVLDCDLVGFTALAESSPPERVAAVLRTYRSVVEDAVFAEGGAILAHTGDGTVALFGLNATESSSAAHALAAAHRIGDAWTRLTVSSPELPKLVAGIDFGLARVGLVGEHTLSLLALGAALDGAAALQRATRAAKAPLLVSDAVVEELKRNAATAGYTFELYSDGEFPAWCIGPTGSD